MHRTRQARRAATFVVAAGTSALAMAVVLGWPSSPRSDLASVAPPAAVPAVPAVAAQEPVPVAPPTVPSAEPVATQVAMVKAEPLPTQDVAFTMVSPDQVPEQAPMADAPPPAEPGESAVVEHTLTIKRGDTLMGVLVSAGVDATEAHSSIQALQEVWDPRQLRPGHEITLTFDATATPDGNEVFQGFTFEPQPALRVGATRDPASGTFAPAEEKAPVMAEKLRGEGTIENSLFQDGSNAGIPITVLSEIIKAFSYDVDFQRDIQPGDRFEVMFDRERTEDGRTVREGDVAYAALTLSGKRYEIYRYQDSQGDVDYYDAKGHSVRKALLRTPINGARLSSGYGMRTHPVLGYSKMHKGIDFAAPTGTPIYAAGDGVIEKAGANGSYGNYVRIRHNKEFDTAYAHMSKVAPGMKPGARVKQGDVIGYVGSTGRSTGPHLHYEILKNGSQVNPQGVRFPTGRILEAKELQRFKTAMTEVQRTYASLPTISKVASAGQ
ncbi:peptidoglycan DD-metalloendopeptidase family protein [Caenispirillum bisanense]|uniref:peptidoglycan DD-metalloendopeptidase family protein n=1 Tax=Caenispirillum bisanense TaxID=414052 RepID=UPI0031DC9758